MSLGLETSPYDVMFKEQNISIYWREGWEVVFVIMYIEKIEEEGGGLFNIAGKSTTRSNSGKLKLDQFNLEIAIFLAVRLIKYWEGLLGRWWIEKK